MLKKLWMDKSKKKEQRYEQRKTSYRKVDSNHQKVALLRDVREMEAPNADVPISISKESYRRNNSTTRSLDTKTTKSFPAHCLFPTVGFSVSGPFDHSTWLSNLSPSPTNRSGTNSSALSNILGSLVANG
jgi:hypothetical protein